MSMSIVKDVSEATGNPFAQFYALDSKEQFPSWDPDVQDKRVGTTFYGDFKVAESFVRAGEPRALESTWKRAWDEWRNNAAYVTELCLVMNHLSWEHEEDDGELCRWYAGKYELCRSRIFSSGSEDEPLPEGCTPFTVDEQTQAFNVLD